MAVTVDITQSDLFKAIRVFIVSLLPNGVEVFQGQTNRVPEPVGQNFVVMTPLFRNRIEWNTTRFVDGYPDGPSVRTDTQPTEFKVQLDFHGPNSGDYAQAFTTLFFSGYAYDSFFGELDIKPLYNTDPRQVPFTNGEQQIEQRWVVDIAVQANITTTTPQEFADAVTVNVISVEERYPVE